MQFMWKECYKISRVKFVTQNYIFLIFTLKILTISEQPFLVVYEHQKHNASNLLSALLSSYISEVVGQIYLSFETALQTIKKKSHVLF